MVGVKNHLPPPVSQKSPLRQLQRGWRRRQGVVLEELVHDLAQPL